MKMESMLSDLVFFLNETNMVVRVDNHIVHSKMSVFGLYNQNRIKCLRTNHSRCIRHNRIRNVTIIRYIYH